jgi:hypothetical protein
MITKPTFVGPDFTRRPVKYERFIRPMGLRYKKANVTVSSNTFTLPVDFVLIINLASWTRRNCSPTYYQREKESAKPDVYTIRQVYLSANTSGILILFRRTDQGYNY